MSSQFDVLVDALEIARVGLADAKQALVDEVRQSPEGYLWVKEHALYVGPDRHNEETVVLWDAPGTSNAKNAAAQMLMDGARTCGMRNCECKRQPQRGNYRSW